MSWHYLPGQVAESLAELFSDGEPCAPLKSSPSVGRCFSDDSKMDAYRGSLSGMMSAHLTEDPGEDLSTLSPEASHVRTSQPQEKAQESQESVQGYGLKWPGLSVKFDRLSSSWKIHPCLFPGASMSCSVTLPRWGMMRSGELSELTMPAHLTVGNASGYWHIPTPTCADAYTSKLESSQQSEHTMHSVSLAQLCEKMPEKMWPTPSSRDWKDTPGMSPTGVNPDGSKRTRLDQLARRVYHGGKQTRQTWPTPRQFMHKDSETDRGKSNIGEVVGGALNPDWVEWLMGWPIGWTALKPLETDRFQQWRRLHGTY